MKNTKPCRLATPLQLSSSSIYQTKQSLSFSLKLSLSPPPPSSQSKASFLLLYHHYLPPCRPLKPTKYYTDIPPPLSISSSHLISSMDSAAPLPVSSFNYPSHRTILKDILEKEDDALMGQKVVVGGWVKTSKEVKKDIPKQQPPSPPQPQPQPQEAPPVLSSGPKSVSCVEIIQSRIPFFRTIVKVLGCGKPGGDDVVVPQVRDKVEPLLPSPPPPSTAHLLLNDGSCVASLQVVVHDSVFSPIQLLPIGTCIVAEGIITQASERDRRRIELVAERILHIGTADLAYPLSKKKVPLEKLRDFCHLRTRTTTMATVMRIRGALSSATYIFFHNTKFLCVQVPTVTTTDSEGVSEKFQITTLPFYMKEKESVSLEAVKAAIKEKSNKIEELKRTDSNREALVAALQDLQKANELATQLQAKEKAKVTPDDFFSNQAYLTVSGRLHLESYACSLGNVYAFGPRFQADRSPKHAAEMWMVEVEMAFSQLEDAINCVYEYFKFLCRHVLQNCSEDMMFAEKRIDKNCSNRLRSIISGSYEKISYTEAVDILKKVKKFEANLEHGAALTAEQLSYLTDEAYKMPVIVYNYPKHLKPFYVRLNDDGKTVAAFDLIVPKVGTLVRGSQNEERIDMINTRINELGLPKEQYEWYLDLDRYGTVKRAGFSFAFDLMVLFTTGLNDVRDVIPFPRTYGKVSN